MSTPASPMSADVMSDHEAGHAFAALVLGIPFIELTIVPGENGKIGVDFKVMPWTSPRPETKLTGFTDEECKEVSRDDLKCSRFAAGHAIFSFLQRPFRLAFAVIGLGLRTCFR
jgi:hypothetical protein